LTGLYAHFHKYRSLGFKFVCENIGFTFLSTGVPNYVRDSSSRARIFNTVLRGSYKYTHKIPHENSFFQQFYLRNI